MRLESETLARMEEQEQAVKRMDEREYERREHPTGKKASSIIPEAKPGHSESHAYSHAYAGAVANMTSDSESEADL